MCKRSFSRTLIHILHGAPRLVFYPYFSSSNRPEDVAKDTAMHRRPYWSIANDNKVDNINMNNFHLNFNMPNLISNDVSAVKPKGELLQHVNSNHNHCTRLSHKMKTPVVVRSKVRDIKNLPTKFRTCYHSD